LEVARRGEFAADTAVVAQIEFQTEARAGPAREAAVVMAKGQLEP
jgi:hypothetical protein